MTAGTSEVPGPSSEAGPPDPPAAPLGKFAARGFVWQTGATAAIKLISVVSNLILAKILSQDDFGVVALAYSITFLGGTLANAGVSDVLVQRQARLHLWVNPGFWLSLGCGLAGAVITLGMAPVAAVAFEDRRLLGLIAVVAAGIPLQNFATVPDAILQSRLRFRLVAALTLAAAVVQTALTLILAFIGFQAYSFVLPPPIVALGAGVAKWMLAKPNVQFAPQIRRWRYLLGDASSVFGVRLLLTFLGQADYITLGLLYAKPIVGAYYFAFNLAVQVARLAVGNFNSVLYPTLSRMSGDPKRQLDATLKTARMIVAVCVPLFFLQAAVAGPAEQLLFGGKWRNAVPVMQILSVGMAVASAGWVTEPFLRSLGQFKFYFRFVFISTPLMLGAIYVGARSGGAGGTACGVVASWIILHLVGLSIALIRCKASLLHVVRLYAVPVPAATLAIGGGWLASELLAIQPLLSMATCAIVGLSGYAAVIHWFAPDVWFELRARLFRV